MLADDAGYPCIRVQNEGNDERLVDVTEWVLVTKDEGFLRRVREKVRDTEIPLPPGIRLWTDDYNSLFTVLR